jgi:hypothetical protein
MEYILFGIDCVFVASTLYFAWRFIDASAEAAMWRDANVRAVSNWRLAEAQAAKVTAELERAYGVRKPADLVPLHGLRARPEERS